MLSLPPLISLSVPPSVFLCVSPPVSPLLTCAHSVICSSLSPSFLCISLSCSSSPLHQIEADSCHQAYFRRWHTHAHTPTHSRSLFALSFCLSPSPLISPSSCFDSYLLVSNLDWFLKLGSHQQKIWRKTKAKGGITPLLLLPPFSPVSTCPSGRLLQGGDFSLCVSPLSVSLFEHASLIHL